MSAQSGGEDLKVYAPSLSGKRDGSILRLTHTVGLIARSGCYVQPKLKCSLSTVACYSATRVQALAILASEYRSDPRTESVSANTSLRSDVSGSHGRCRCQFKAMPSLKPVPLVMARVCLFMEQLVCMPSLWR
jgi:hypothetical protein